MKKENTGVKENDSALTIRRAEHTAAALLSALCILPVLISFFDVYLGFRGDFTEKELESIHSGVHYYPQSIHAYYLCFCILGSVILLYVIISAILSYRRVFSRDTVKNNPWFFLLLMLLLWSVVCALLSDDFIFSFIGEKYLHDGLSSYFIYAGVFVCASMIRRERARMILLRVYCTVVVYLSLIMIVQQAVHGKIDYAFPSFRAVVFNQFNHFGYILCMSVAACAGLYLYDKTAGKVLKAVYICGFCFETYALLVNDTFGSYLAALIALPVIILFWYLHGNKLSVRVFLPLILFIVISAASFCGMLPLAQGLETNVDVLGTDVQNIAVGSEEADHAGTGRYILWKDTVQRIKEHPVFGVGPEGLVGDNAITNIDSPHNEYLQIAAFLGIPGLLLYLAALFTLAAHHLKNIKKLDPMVLAVAGVTVTYLISACFGNPVFNTYPYFWMLLGLTTATNESEYPVVSLIDTDLEALLQKPTAKRIAVLLTTAVVIMAGLALLYIHQEKKIETQHEITDLQTMRSAESIAKVRLKNNPEKAEGSYWLATDDLSFVLVRDSKPAPDAYGTGKKMTGGGFDVFKKDTGLDYDYDEGLNYTDKVIRVTIDPDAAEEEQIRLEWIESKQ